jgi:hypothetical protein
MVVYEALLPLPGIFGLTKDDRRALPGGKRWYEDEGVCGFAWVTVRPATTGFARWLLKSKRARVGYHGGAQIWVHDFGQSMARKEAYARAFAKVLVEAGYSAVADSRLD